VSAAAVTLTGTTLDVAGLHRIAVERAPVSLDTGALAAVAENRRSLEAAIDRGETIYGITTGLGALVRERISAEEATAMQRDILRSHAAGVGEPLPREVVRAALALRLNGLLRARSGVRPLVLERVADLLNLDLVAPVPSTGSLGASGDLAPSAHAFLPLIGEGELTAADGVTHAAIELLAENGLEPLELEAKEALALVNGTHFMTAIGALLSVRVARLLDSADGAAALTLEALHGAPAAFDPRVHELRPLPGQARSAASVRALVAGSERLGTREYDDVQDAYSLRCVPQVHGAAREAAAFFVRMVAVDLNAVTDNPLVLETGEIVSAGNFHGQSLAIAFDTLRIALADVSSISERRTFRLLSPSLNHGLPAFLAQEAGRASGYMVAQYTAAALVAELRALAHPASVDSIPTSDNQEDHVSMGMTGALLALRACQKAETVVAVEVLCATQGLETGVRRPGRGVTRLVALVRERVPALEEDRPPAPDIEAVRRLVASGALAAVVQQLVGSAGTSG
jgi:histidine ammonia-lyase